MIIQGPKGELTDRATSIIATHLRAIVAKRGQAIIGVVGGRSVADIFRQLGQQDLPWAQVYFLLLDERLVPPNHHESNYRLVREALGPHASANFASFCTDPINPRGNLSSYNELLARLGGTIDIALVSGGEDGHIASLFPLRGELKHSKPEFILVTDAPKPPPDRMSASPVLISKASVGLLLLIGASKQQALANFLDQKTTVEECPAKLIAQLPENYLLTDLNLTTS